jgi:glycosyltransferase involved in cell wall biosynthesis
MQAMSATSAGGVGGGQVDDSKMPSSGAPLFMLLEEFHGLDEGYDKFCSEVTQEIARRRPVVQHVMDQSQDPEFAPLRFVGRLWATVRAARRPDVRRLRPASVLYMPRQMTGPVLLRARLLRLLLGVPVAMTLVEEEVPASGRLLARWMPPDLLLLGTEKECEEARAAGLRAELVWGGVDTARFRPPTPGEKEALRRKWNLPAGDRIVLHVGHLIEERNLRPLARLAAVEGVRVVLLISHWRREESDRLQRELEDQGVVVLTGFQPEIEELYRLADCYVFPTVVPTAGVPMPLSVLEARASGLPVVARRFRALAGEVGAALGLDLVDSDQELVERTLDVLGSEAQPGTVPQSFSWRGVALRVTDLLATLGDGGPSDAGGRPAVDGGAGAGGTRPWGERIRTCRRP